MVTYPEALAVVQEQAAAGKSYVVLALKLGGFSVMSAQSYDLAPASEAHPFSVAHDTRRSDGENRELFITACYWQRDAFGQETTEEE